MHWYNKTYESTEDEENHENSSQGRLAGNVAIADRRHRDEREVNAVPIGQILLLAITRKRVVGIFDLHVHHTN